MIKTLFIGSAEFAVPALKKLIEMSDYEVVGVVTQPDRPVGRHHSNLEPTPIKKFLQENSSSIKIYQPEKIKDEGQKILDETQPDLIIVAAYGQIIPKYILDYPKYSALNIHGSILPKLRGAVPMNMAILQGFETTGVTLQIMDVEMDKGDILSTKEIEISNDETTETLGVRLSNLGAELLEETLPDWIGGKITPVAQDESKATFCYKKDLRKENARIDWGKSAEEINRAIRAYYPWPIAWTKLTDSDGPKDDTVLEASSEFAGKIFKIYKAEIVEEEYPSYKSAKLFVKDDDLYIRCKIGWLKVIECQLEGKKRLPAKEYLYLAEDKTERVRGLLVHNGNILLVKRVKPSNTFYMSPGGAIGVNESHQDALVREFKEETNLDIEVEDLIYTFESDSIVKHNLYKVSLKDDKIEANINGEEKYYKDANNYYELVWLPVDEVIDLKVNGKLSRYLIENYKK